MLQDLGGVVSHSSEGFFVVLSYFYFEKVFGFSYIDILYLLLMLVITAGFFSEIVLLYRL